MEAEERRMQATHRSRRMVRAWRRSRAIKRQAHHVLLEALEPRLLLSGYEAGAAEQPAVDRIDPAPSGLQVEAAPIDAVDIIDVLVRGSDWGPAMGLQSITALSHGAGDGTTTTRVSLPWTGIDQIALQLANDIAPVMNDLWVVGIDVPVYDVVDFTHDATSRTGTWTLGAAITGDVVAVSLAGSTFATRLGVLPGDVDGDGATSVRDIGVLRAHLGAAPGVGVSAPMVADVNADGIVSATDALLVRRDLGRLLPDGDPADTLPARPGIDIQKLTNGQDAHDPHGPEVPLIAPGDTVEWLYIVTNTGNVPFEAAEIAVRDDQFGVNPAFDPTTDEGGDRVLSPGEQWHYRATGVALDLSAVAGTAAQPAVREGGTTYDVRTGGPLLDGTSRFHFDVTGEDPILVDVDVRLAIEHESNQDLDIFLISPSGTRVRLLDDLAGRNFQDTLLDDAATLPIGEATPPFIGMFQPEGPLWTSAGENPNGVWTLEIIDDFPLFEGSLFGTGEPAPWGPAVGTQLTIDAVSELGPTIVPGCDPGGSGLPRPTYENVGTVVARDNTDSDVSHYCNPDPPEARITIFADDVNEVGNLHTLTVMVEENDGFPAHAPGGDEVSGFRPAAGETVTVRLEALHGAMPDLIAPLDLRPSAPSVVEGTTDADGRLTVRFVSATAGQVVTTASSSVAVGDTTVLATTDGTAGSSGPSTKTFVDAKIAIGSDGSAQVGEPQRFNVTVWADDGRGTDLDGSMGTFDRVEGATVYVILSGADGATPEPAGVVPGVTRVDGTFSVAFTSAHAGQVIGTAWATMLVNGVTVAHGTDGRRQNSGPAVKIFLDASNTIVSGGGAAALAAGPEGDSSTRAPSSALAAFDTASRARRSVLADVRPMVRLTSQARLRRRIGLMRRPSGADGLLWRPPGWEEASSHPLGADRRSAACHLPDR